MRSNCPSDATACSPGGVESRVASDIAARQRLGLKKYGISVEDNPLPLREWLEHAYQESLDLPIYLKRAIEEIDRANAGADGRGATGQPMTETE